MAYAPDPTDVSQPLDDVEAKTAAAEFRALKAYIAGLTLGDQNAAIYRKNLLHNGSFEARQRLSVAGASSVDVYLTDRWKLKRNFAANITGNILTGIVNLDPAASDCVLASGAAAAGIAPGAAQYLGIEQTLEFQTISQLLPGLAGAKTVTFSGWISCATTGLLPIYFQNGARTRSYVTSVNIVTAGVWQFFAVTLVLDVAGAWIPALESDAGLIVGFGMAGGATYQAGAANVWGAGDFRGLAGQVNFYGTNGWVSYFHGLQLEVGGAATTFEKLPKAMNLEITQRYFERSYNQDLTAAPISTAGQGAYAVATAAGAGTNRCPFHFQTRKRIAPTMTFPTASRNISAAQDGGVPTLQAGTISERGGIATIVGGAAWAVGQSVMFAFHADADF